MNDVQKAIEDQFRDVDSDNEVPDQIFERVTNVGGRGNSLSFCISMHMSIAIFRKKKLILSEISNAIFLAHLVEIFCTFLHVNQGPMYFWIGCKYSCGHSPQSAPIRDRYPS